MKKVTTVSVDKIHQHDIRGRIAHNLRIGHCDGVDASRSTQNRVLFGYDVRPKNVLNLIKQLSGAERFRKNAVLGYEVFVEVPENATDWSKDRFLDWEQRSLKWARGRPGKLVQAVSHYDELRAHLHFIWAAVFQETKDRVRPAAGNGGITEKKSRRHCYGNLRAGDLIDRPFITGIHDSYFDEVGRDFGFKRGIRGVRASQETLKQYGAAISAPMPEINVDSLDLEALPKPKFHVTAKGQRAVTRQIAEAIVRQLMNGPLKTIHQKALRNDEYRARVTKLEALLEAKDKIIEEQAGVLKAALAKEESAVEALKKRITGLENHLGTTPTDLQLLEAGGMSTPEPGQVGRTRSGKSFRVTEGKVALLADDGGERQVTGLQLMREVCELSSRDALAVAVLEFGRTNAAALVREDLVFGDRATYSMSVPLSHHEPTVAIASDYPWAGDGRGEIKEALRGVVVIEPSGGVAFLKRSLQGRLEGRTHLDRDGRVVQDFGSVQAAVWGRGDEEGPLTLSGSVEVWSDLCERVKGVHVLVTDTVPVGFIDNSMASRRREICLVDTCADVRALWASQLPSDPRRQVREVGSVDQLISGTPLDPTEQFLGKATWGIANDGIDIT